ncbi:MAG: TVP38/TMEM64 family protein [Pyramidobacter sp.]|jgi:uncharacterized membrane protein YdjX (TVP38/TMEM64 family)
MKRRYFYALLRYKISSLFTVVVSAFVIAAVMFVIYHAVMWLIPASAADAWRGWIAEIFNNPETFRNRLLQKGSAAPLIFLGAQVLQVVFAPIPGQAVALAGGYVFGFWKGWLLTTAGLTLGSLIAMGLGRLLGRKFVRRVVSAKTLNRFDSLTGSSGYMTFLMIFLLPALPDDAVCFIAGLTQLKLLPLSAVCFLGRAPGMAVLSLLGAGLSTGLTTGVKVLFVTLMILSVPLWLFSEVIGKKLRRLVLRRKRAAGEDKRNRAGGTDKDGAVK